MDLLGPKLLFIALNLGGLALGVWKVRFFVFLLSYIGFQKVLKKEKKCKKNSFLIFDFIIENTKEN